MFTVTITPATPGKPRIKREVMMDGEELVRVLRLHACLRGDDANVSCCAASGDDAGRRSNAQVVCSSKVDTVCFPLRLPRRRHDLQAVPNGQRHTRLIRHVCASQLEAKTPKQSRNGDGSFQQRHVLTKARTRTSL